MKRSSDRSLDVSPAFGVVDTAVDFSAALCFIAGSMLFFSKDRQTGATWLVLTGATVLAGKPPLRLARELKLVAMGDTKDRSKRFCLSGRRCDRGGLRRAVM